MRAHPKPRRRPSRRWTPPWPRSSRRTHTRASRRSDSPGSPATWLAPRSFRRATGFRPRSWAASAGPGLVPPPGVPPAPPGSRVPRPDGGAVTYLDFDSSAGGRWFGERVEVATGVRTPVEWSFGGNPLAVIRVGPGAGETMRFNQAPPRDADGRITPDGALWS